MRVFTDRRHAGRELGVALREGVLADRAGRVVVLGIPRGGVPVAAEVADALDAALDVVVVRKLRSPHNPELGFGAVGSDGHVDLDDDLIARIGLSAEEVRHEVEDRRAVVAHRLAEYRKILPEPDLSGATAVVVDDGIATGGTARQACALARRQGASRVLLAAPVGPPRTDVALEAVADDIVVLSRPAEFMAVGQAYEDFAQLGDEEVAAALRQAAARRA